MSEARARRLVAERSGGVCERCGRARAGEWHHRVNRSQGGRWTASNGLHLCGTCHGWVTAHPEAAAAPGCGWALRSWQDPLAVPVRLHLWGLVLLDDCGCFTPQLAIAP